ncbi:tyrosine-protein kinase receptor torso-like [Chelonus insularis]|uniref:tyrosine-protein kinase receptor torso-like n=1 Tax=Chelonus insularis TaxID=460826 RepID=UPI00158E4570|nr:tyrosine-protein kinase receptor torso-like [Chelonus insularis]
MYFVILFLIVFEYVVQGISIDEAFQEAGCLVRCKEISCLNNCRNITLVQERIPVRANFNASLHCRDVDFLSILHSPGTFVIEQNTSDDNIWSNPVVYDGRISMFFDLQPGTRYRYRSHKITKEGISLPEISDWFQTTANNVQPEPISYIFVQKIIPDGKNDTHLKAEIILDPAKDRSCFYDILSWTQDEGLSINHFNASHDFKFNLHGLDYSRNYTLIVSAKNRGSHNNSKNVTHSFITPSCSDMFKNLTICPPNLVENFQIIDITELGDKFNFIVSWKKPDIIPDNYTIQVIPVDETEKPDITTVPGESTEALCSVNKSETLYVISIYSESAGGTSLPVSIFRTFTRENTYPSTVSIEMIIIPSVASMIIIATIFYFYCKHNKKHKNDIHNKVRKNKTQLKYRNNIKDSINLNPVYEKLLKSTLNLENKMENESFIAKDVFEIKPMQLMIKDVLGSGISGVVRLGLLQVDQNKSIEVAVKMLKDCPSAEEIRNFKQEISIMKSAGIHPNIVSLIGCCTSCQIPMLVVEYCSKGDLQSYLRNIWKDIMNDINENNHLKSLQVARENPTYLISSTWNKDAVSNRMYDIQEEYSKKTEKITAKELLTFAWQVANGMEFLSLNRIVHRDLAARNVLVCADLTVKISDFGLSRDVYRESVYKKKGNGKLPVKWMAIEALTHQLYTSQSDVWSFGILLWEIVTLGCNPYPEIPTNMILHYLKSGKRMVKPSNCGSQLYELMNACWRTSPKSRPTFTELKHAIGRLLESVTQHEYINLQNEAFQVPNVREIVE